MMKKMKTAMELSFCLIIQKNNKKCKKTIDLLINYIYN